MPIVDVTLVAHGAEEVPAGLAQSLADAIAGVYCAPPGEVWVRLQVLPATHYAENGTPVDEQPMPVFVRVLTAEAAAGARAAQAQALAAAVATACARMPQRVHVLFEPAATGRIAFGGVLLQ